VFAGGKIITGRRRSPAK